MEKINKFEWKPNKKNIGKDWNIRDIMTHYYNYIKQYSDSNSYIFYKKLRRIKYDFSNILEVVKDYIINFILN